MLDFDFISRLEGKAITKGYVPQDKQKNVIGESGVTIGTGVDLGQQSLASIQRLKLSKNLEQHLLPYLGKKKEEALKLLQEKPLTLSTPEVEELDKAIKLSYLSKAILAYNRGARKANSKIHAFSLLPEAVQTVIYSLKYNLGDLSKSAPKTWAAVLENDWQKVYNNLMDFGHKNQGLTNRRMLEAKYLKENLKDGSAIKD